MPCLLAKTGNRTSASPYGMKRIHYQLQYFALCKPRSCPATHMLPDIQAQ